MSILTIDPRQVAESLVDFLYFTFKKQSFTKAVLGVSGGIDSAVSLSLAVKALGKKNVYPCILPYGTLNPEGKDDALKLVVGRGVPEENISVIDIKKSADEIIGNATTKDHVRVGNIMVRTRMIYLFDMAKALNALVVGTENKTERLLGYFTRFGDQASDVEPLGNLYKTQVRMLAEYLEIPERIINKLPTAGLWTGQTDEGEFGFSYYDADRILYMYTEEKLKIEEIIEKGFSKDMVEKVIGRMKANSFKHLAPYYPS